MLRFGTDHSDRSAWRKERRRQCGTIRSIRYIRSIRILPIGKQDRRARP